MHLYPRIQCCCPEGPHALAGAVCGPQRDAAAPAAGGDSRAIRRELHALWMKVTQHTQPGESMRRAGAVSTVATVISGCSEDTVRHIRKRSMGNRTCTVELDYVVLRPCCLLSICSHLSERTALLYNTNIQCCFLVVPPHLYRPVVADFAGYLRQAPRS